MYTGQPMMRISRAWMTRVYPRVYGATFAASRGVDPGRGLSPCVRGNLFGFRLVACIMGSIPVCKGQPSILIQGLASPGVYPRVYGATVNLLSGREVNRGLSPCVRGNLGDSLFSVRGTGSIPVCTGQPT